MDADFQKASNDVGASAKPKWNFDRLKRGVEEIRAALDAPDAAEHLDEIDERILTLAERSMVEAK